MDMPMNPTDTLTIVLQAQEWNLVMSALQKAPIPYEFTAPVIGKLGRQFEERPRMPGNGAAVDFPEGLTRRPARDA